jgi:8-oxo-dGTP diphosphatase
MSWPKAAVSAAIFRDGQVLLAERGKPPLTGIWSLPGGHVETGETVRQAALREVMEETGITAEIVGHLDVHDVIVLTDDDGKAGNLRAHYVLNVFYGRWLAGEPKAASDCRNARFVDVDDVAGYPLTNGAEGFIRRAYAKLYE